MNLVSWLVALLLAIGSCSAGSAPRSELEAARDRWEAAGITSYRYEIVKRCFCPQLDAAVEVVDGEVVSVVPLSPDAIAPEARTVEEMFDVLEEELASPDRGEYTIEFHPELGYPMRVVADPIAMAIDDEYQYEITLVEP